MTALDLILSDGRRASSALELAAAAAALGRPVRLLVRRPALDELDTLELGMLAELGGEIALCAGGAADLGLGSTRWPVEGLIGWLARGRAGASLVHV